MKGSRIAVLGAGRSGVAVAKAASRRGAFVTIFDAKPEDELAESLKGLDRQIVLVVGGFQGSITRKQAETLVISPSVDSRSPLIAEAITSGVEVIGEIEFAFRISKAPIVAITGTNGKSTTTVMTWLAMQGTGVDSMLCGNIYGSGYNEMTLTEAADYARPEQALVAEVSSFQLEMVKQFRPRVAGITNISPDHLNRYDSYEDYVRAKQRIFANMGRGDYYVHHRDAATAPPEGAKFRVLLTDYHQSQIRIPGGVIAISGLPLYGQHNLANAAMAATITAAFHLSNGNHSDQRMAKAITDGFMKFQGLAHRMERVGEKDGVEFINNSMCTNPAAVVASSKSLPKPQHLLVGGITKGLNFTPLREYLSNSSHRVYLYGSEGGEINTQLGGDFPVFRTMAEAFGAAVRAAKPGDAVMLSPGCASMDQYQDFTMRGKEFREMAKEWLEDDKVAAH